MTTDTKTAKGLPRTRVLKINLTDDQGVLIDSLTMRVDVAWHYFSVNPVQGESDPKASEFVLIAH